MDFDQIAQAIAQDEMLPTKWFCEQFIKRLPSEELLDKYEYYNDSRDYHSWGYAINQDIHHNGEDWGHIWEWVRYYEHGTLNQSFTPQQWNELVQEGDSYEYDE